MQIFIRVFFIFIFFCSAILIKHDSSINNKIIPNSYSYISETKQETELSFKTEEYFITANNQNRNKITNNFNKNNHIGLSLGCTNLNQLNILNKFVIYKDKLFFKYILYRILNYLRNSIYPNAP